MKNIRMITCALLLFSLHNLKAQVTSASYYIYNNRACDVTVFYEINYCSMGIPPPIPPTNGTVTIGTNVSYVIPGVSIGDDVSVYLMEIDGVSVLSTGYAVVGTPGGCIGDPTTYLYIPLSGVPLSSGCMQYGYYNIDNTGAYTKVGP